MNDFSMQDLYDLSYNLKLKDKLDNLKIRILRRLVNSLIQGKRKSIITSKHCITLDPKNPSTLIVVKKQKSKKLNLFFKTIEKK